MRGCIEMSEKEVKRLQVAEGRITQGQAAERLGLSPRQARPALQPAHRPGGQGQYPEPDQDALCRLQAYAWGRVSGR